MRKKEPCLIITFYTTADAMNLESYCQNNQLPGRLIPIPRELSAGCGMAWRITCSSIEECAAKECTSFSNQESFLAFLKQSGIPFEHVAEMDA